ncbi:MAG: hypothetical protein KDD58_15230 [Bdellovibrionales bacterium]|nr:hypothetical protein [Bdellovibrionales bacterium]
MKKAFIYWSILIVHSTKFLFAFIFLTTFAEVKAQSKNTVSLISQELPMVWPENWSIQFKNKNLKNIEYFKKIALDTYTVGMQRVMYINPDVTIKLLESSRDVELVFTDEIPEDESTAADVIGGFMFLGFFKSNGPMKMRLGRALESLTKGNVETFRSTFFHETLHCLGFDNQFPWEHNKVGLDTLYRDVVFSCSVAAFPKKLLEELSSAGFINVDSVHYNTCRTCALAKKRANHQFLSIENNTGSLATASYICLDYLKQLE